MRPPRKKEGLAPDSPVYQQKMTEFRERMQVYINERLYPRIPDHQLMCFYPMNKQRGDKENAGPPARPTAASPPSRL